MRISARRAFFAISISIVPAPAIAQSELKYPIVFEDRDGLHTLGISIEMGHDQNKRHYRNKCYNYGDGGHELSVSDAMLARYTAKGFTLHSLCLGLVSEARFDPETGKRLPTFILVDKPALLKALRGRDPKKLSEKQLSDCCVGESITTPEWPLKIPDCFKGGTPYSDCNWRYGVTTGVKLSAESTKRFRDFGRALETGMARLMRGELKCNPNAGWPCGGKRIDVDERGFLSPKRDQISLALELVDVNLLPKSLTRSTAATFVDVSQAFPRGFGYALHAIGDAGGSAASLFSVRAASSEGRPSSRIDIAGLQRATVD